MATWYWKLCARIHQRGPTDRPSDRCMWFVKLDIWLPVFVAITFTDTTTPINCPGLRDITPKCFNWSEQWRHRLEWMQHSKTIWYTDGAMRLPKINKVHDQQFINAYIFWIMGKRLNVWSIQFVVVHVKFAVNMCVCTRVRMACG